jgi:hypothetical protein
MASNPRSANYWNAGQACAAALERKKTQPEKSRTGIGVSAMAGRAPGSILSISTPGAAIIGPHLVEKCGPHLVATVRVQARPER